MFGRQHFSTFNYKGDRRIRYSVAVVGRGTDTGGERQTSIVIALISAFDNG
jgi:hypothetical protein